MEKQCMLSTCRKFPQGSIHHQHFCEPQRPTFSLPWKMSGTYHARQNVLKGFNFFFLPRAIIKSIEVWVFSSLLSLLSDILAPPLTGSSALHMLGCCERGRMVWEGGGHMAWLIFTALWHHSSKPCFPEGCRICLAAWLWAASQCPSGRTAGRHFLQIPASFVLLENVACWYSKEYYRTSCVMESLGMLPQLAFEFSVVLNTKCFSGVTPFFLFLHFLLDLRGIGCHEFVYTFKVKQEFYSIHLIDPRADFSHSGGRREVTNKTTK